MNFFRLFIFISLISLAFAQYPAMPDFNFKNSDPKAISIADSVMKHLGGYENWKKTRYISWSFFGRRLHYWDKWTGNIRIEVKDMTILMNIHTMKGRVYRQEKELLSDSVNYFLKWGKSLWINDSYWLVMPYKLKDSGVSLNYLSEGKTSNGKDAYRLQLSFEKVGDTPENKYIIYVDKMNYIVRQWDFYRKFNDTKAQFSTPWKNWKSYGKILLSDDRGRGKHTDLHVYEKLPQSVFLEVKKTKYSKLN